MGGDAVRGRTWDVKWSLAKKLIEVDPCYSRLGVTELQPQVFCFANKVLLEHSQGQPFTYYLCNYLCNRLLLSSTKGGWVVWTAKPKTGSSWLYRKNLDLWSRSRKVMLTAWGEEGGGEGRKRSGPRAGVFNMETREGLEEGSGVQPPPCLTTWGSLLIRAEPQYNLSNWIIYIIFSRDFLDGEENRLFSSLSELVAY